MDTKKQARLIQIFVSSTLFTISFLFLIISVKFMNSKTISLAICSIIFLIFIFQNIFVWNTIVRLKKIISFQRKNSVAEQKYFQEIIEKQRNFILSFSHEIKTTLTLINNYLKKFILQLRVKLKGDTSLRIGDKILQIYEKAQREIINLLNVDKIEKYQMLYNHNRVIDLRNVLREELELFHELAEEKNIKITSYMKKAYIRIDPLSVNRIINNLLDNAIKYNRENGWVNIRLKTEKGKVFLMVKDRGVGMDEDQLNHIFEPCFNAINRNKGIHGLGIGLCIANNIVKQAGGKILVESKKDKGSTFTVIFPESKKTHEEQLSMEKLKKYPERVSNVKLMEEIYSPNLPVIFIVDDDIELISYLRLELNEVFNVYYATNGKEALQKIVAIPKPDIIVSDIVMNEMDGFEFKNELYEMKDYKAIPFIFLSAKNASAEKIKGLVKGAVGYITKPFNINELFVTISSIMDFTMLRKKSDIEEFQKKISTLLNQPSTNTDHRKENFDQICFKYKINRTEKEIIRLLIQGKEYKQIANELYKSYHTIRNQVQSIHKKLDVKSNKEILKVFSKMY